jgi:mannose-1-phosphate guanylyltransferase
MNSDHSKRADRWCVIDGCSQSARITRDVRVFPMVGRLRADLSRARQVASSRHIWLAGRRSDQRASEPNLWWLPSHHRVFIEPNQCPLIPVATAVLSIASQTPYAVVAILPSECPVTMESRLMGGLEVAFKVCESTPHCACTLGMLDTNPRHGADYLITDHARFELVIGKARAPPPGLAHKLFQQGAVVSSGIIVARAGVLGDHIRRHWRHLSADLLERVLIARSTRTECNLPASMCQTIPGAVLKSLSWIVPTLPMHVVRVHGSGWGHSQEAKCFPLGDHPRCTKSGVSRSTALLQ